MFKTIRLSVLLLLCSVWVLSAQQQITLHIEPSVSQGKSLTVELNKPVQFSAKAYWYDPSTNMRGEAQISKLDWSVDPSAFGTIDANGLFIVTGPSGGMQIQEGRIIAVAEVNGLTITGTVAAKLGTNGGGGTTLDYTINGSVKNSNGDPIIGAEMLAIGGSNPSTNLTAKTDANGNYTLKVPAGSFYIRASAQGYLTEYYENANSTVNAKKITTGDPTKKDITGIDFVLGTTGRISGTVYDENKSPLTDATIMAYGTTGGGIPGGNNGAYSGRTDRDGNYTIDGVMEGEYIVQASRQGYKLQYYNLVTEKLNATAVVVKDGQHSTGIDFILGKDVIIPLTYYDISGTVTDANANGIAEAIIVAQGQSSSPNNGMTYTAKADRDGHYSFKVIAGSYIVSATANGFVKEYYDNVSKSDLATTITVDAANPSAANINFTLGQGGFITGTVINASTQSPVKGAYVSIGSIAGTPGNPQTGNTVMTDEHGSYKLTGLLTGEYTVTARAEGFALQFYDKVADATLATKVQVTEGQTTSGIDFALVVLPGVTGKVTDAATNLPIQKAEVSIIGGGMRIVAQTNEHGEYHLALNPGTYVIQASANKYATEWYNEKADPTLADAVTVGTTSIDNINFTLERWGGTIKGVVTDAANTGIHGAVVKVWGTGTSNTPNNSRFYEKAVTNADGSYEVMGVPPGKYYVMAGANGFISEYFDNAVSLSSATMVEVTNQNVTDDIDFELSKGGSITGVVTDAKTNLPVKYASVSIKGLTATSLSSDGTRTDENGAYTISGLATGGYYLYIAAHGYHGTMFPSDPNAAPVQVTAPNTTSGIDIALEPAPKQGRYRFTGSVVDAQTQMNADLAIVEVISTVSGKILSSTTKSDGRYEIWTDEPGVVRSYAIGYVGSYAGNKRTWQESSPQMNEGELTFELEPQSETGFAMLSGKVLDSKTNAPVSEAWVYGTDDEGNTFFSITDQYGAYRIAGTSTGSLDLVVSGADYSPAQGTGSISGTEGTLNLSASRSNSPTDVEKIALPTAVTLSQNYPNPFNPSTTISFTLPAMTNVTLKVMNLIGQEIATLRSGLSEAGTHRVTWNADGIPSGVYLYKLEANGKTFTRQMILTK